MLSRSQDTKALKFNVVLDTKARMQFPTALTLAEIRCEASQAEFRDLYWLLSEAQRELSGNSFPLIGLRRMKGNEVLDLELGLKHLEDNETLVCIYLNLGIY